MTSRAPPRLAAHLRAVHDVACQIADWVVRQYPALTFDREAVQVEDLLVSLADKIWKNMRVPELEDLVVARLAATSGRSAWEEFLLLDNLLASIGQDADSKARLPSRLPGSSLTAGVSYGCRALPQELATRWADPSSWQIDRSWWQIQEGYREDAPCKRQASGSIPLTGSSQVKVRRPPQFAARPGADQL